MKIICAKTPCKNCDCNIPITVKRNSNLSYFMNIFSVIENVSNMDYPFFGNLSKAVGTTLQPHLPLSNLRGWNGKLECDFSIKI